MAERELTKKERDDLVRKLLDLDVRMFPDNMDQSPEGGAWDLLEEQYFQTLGEYSDRLPRMVLAKCPYCGQVLKRVFDPFGIDGPWWFANRLCKFEEPGHCEHFQVLLGAVGFNGREPKEVKEEVRPGPEVPFVVPALLDLPRMVAVVGRVRISTGETSYPIAYFSTEKINPALLHQPWCRNDLWFTDDKGNSCWAVSNEKFDFDLLSYIKDGRLKWVDLDDPNLTLHPVGNEPCPFIDLPGDRERQLISGGERSLIGLPTGEPYNPFE